MLTINPFSNIAEQGGTMKRRLAIVGILLAWAFSLINTNQKSPVSEGARLHSLGCRYSFQVTAHDYPVSIFEASHHFASTVGCIRCDRACSCEGHFLITSARVLRYSKLFHPSKVNFEIIRLISGLAPSAIWTFNPRAIFELQVFP